MLREFLLFLAICGSAFALPQNKELERTGKDTSLLRTVTRQANQALKSTFDSRDSAVVIVKNPADLANRVSNAGDKLVVLYIFGEWCGWTYRINPTVEEVAKNNVDKVLVLRINDGLMTNSPRWNYGVDEVDRVPTFIILRNGTKIEKFMGGSAPKSKMLRDIVARETQNIKITEKLDSQL